MASNGVYVASPASAARVTRGSSTIGAPDGPYQVCIADGTSGTCVGERSFGPGAYKFSIFGYTYESSTNEYSDSLSAAITAGQLPNPTTHLGVRTVLRAKGFDPSNITFNGGTLTPSTLGTTDITDFTLPTPVGTIRYTFPTAFNYGSVAGASTGATANIMQLAGGGNIKIKVSVAGADALYVDYLVPTGSGSDSMRVANNYFVYDPDVQTEYTKSPPSPPPVVSVLTATWTAAGSVDDVTTEGKQAIRDAVATAAGVESSAVTITITASSIVITALITTASAADTLAKATALSTNLGSAAAATSAFAAAGVSVSSDLTLADPSGAVSATDLQQAVAAAPSPSPTLPPPAGSSPVGPIVGAVAGVAILGGLVAAYFLLRKRQAQKVASS